MSETGAATEPRKETDIRIPDAHIHTTQEIPCVLYATAVFFNVGKSRSANNGTFFINGTEAPASKSRREHTAQNRNPVLPRTPREYPIVTK